MNKLPGIIAAFAIIAATIILVHGVTQVLLRLTADTSQAAPTWRRFSFMSAVQ